MSFLDSILGGNTQFGDYTTNGIYAQKSKRSFEDSTSNIHLTMYNAVFL